LINETGIETLEYSERWGNYRIRVTSKDLTANQDFFRKLIRLAKEHRGG